MKFRFVEKLNARNKDANASEMPVIAFLGDSVTQGCFECFVEDNGNIETIYHPELAYSRLLLDKLLKVSKVFLLFLVIYFIYKFTNY